ncbi:uncharacterized protein [Heptranchias perlo]|uniref:uncharacterized protein n=1 Tax=Heptranchias perlo TaxID=212740 RepID=UPI00355A64F7
MRVGPSLNKGTRTVRRTRGVVSPAPCTSQECDGILSTCLDECSSTTLEKLDTIQDKAARSIGAPSSSHIRVLLSMCCSLCGPDETVAAVQGSPLSSTEYETYFSALTPVYRARLVCRKRLNSGCDNRDVATLDQLENHGLVPTVAVCSDIPGFPDFSDFCEFAAHRCATGNFYAKRILCFEDVTRPTSERPRAEPRQARPGAWRPGLGRRSRDLEYEDLLDFWGRPPAEGEGPPPSEFEVDESLDFSFEQPPSRESDLRDLLQRLREPRANRAAGRLRKAVGRGDSGAVDLESQRLLQALKEAGGG